MTRTMLEVRLFKISLGSYSFSPKLIPTVVTILLLFLLYSLGQWQLSRAQFKESLKQQIASRSELKPVDLSMLPDDDQQRQFVPVLVEGEFVEDKNFLLDNQVLEQQAGYNVISLFKTKYGKWLLINRGWIPRTKYRSDMPVFETPITEQTLDGFVRTPHNKVFMLAEQQYDLRRWPVIIQSINIDDLSKVLDRPLLPYVVMLNEKSVAGFNRQWPAYRLDSDKHIGYAVQWFSLFTALVGIFLIVNTKRQDNDDRAGE